MSHYQRAFTKIDQLRDHLASRRFFTWYFGLGIPPVLLGTLLLPYRWGLGWGMLITAIYAAWLVEGFNTVCSRCSFYGTAKCGVPGLIAPYVVKRKSPFSIGIDRVRLHFALDIAIIVATNLIWFYGFRWGWPFVAINTLGGWLTAFRRRRFHGLMYRLRPQTHAPRADTTKPTPGPVPVTLTSTATRRNQHSINQAKAAA